MIIFFENAAPPHVRIPAEVDANRYLTGGGFCFEHAKERPFSRGRSR